MGKVRQGLYLQEWLEQQRQKRQRRKEREQKRLEKERLEKEEARKKREEKERKQQKQQHNTIYIERTTLKIYRTKGRVGKFSSDDELYQTWDELKDAEEKENARLNWTYLPKLIEETKQLINESKSRKRRTRI